MAPDNREHHPDEAQRCRTERRPSIVTVEYEDRDRVGDLISYQNGRKDCALIAGKIGRAQVGILRPAWICTRIRYSFRQNRMYRQDPLCWPVGC